jgi:hypothetical protein
MIILINAKTHSPDLPFMIKIEHSEKRIRHFNLRRTSTKKLLTKIIHSNKMNVRPLKLEKH